MPERGWLRRQLTNIINDDNLDLYLLAVIAMVFTVLGATGVSDIKVLSSVVLALLAISALSQIRSRRLTEQIRNAQRPDPTALFQRKFPEDYQQRRAGAFDLLLIGLSMTRTVQSMRADMVALLAKGGRLRVLTLDPANDSLTDAAEGLVTDNLGYGKLRERIRTSLDDLVTLRAVTNGRLEIRVLATIPTAGFNCVDVTSPDGRIYVMHYEHRPPGEASPVFTLKPGDIPWFQHFTAEAERLWESGTPWPLSSAEQIARARRPVFSEHFGPEFTVAVEGSSELFVTGKARNAFVLTHYNLLERKLRAGSSMRFLLIDPESPAIEVVAHRYVERSAASARERVVHTLRLLTQLRASTQGALSVRLTDHPLAMGVVATDGEAPAVFAEYYSYQAQGDPKFVLQPGNALGYELLLTEAEALWENGKPHDLA
jgi:uncharacterized protein DUF5919